MAYDVQRNLNKSGNQSYTYDAIGHAEDISPILTNITPELTLFYSKFGDSEPAKAMNFSWMTKGLFPPQDNAHLEMEDYKFQPGGSIEGLSNNVQFFQKTGMVSDAQNKVQKAYQNEHGSELADLRYDAYTGLAQDIEYMLVNSTKKVDGSANVQPRSGGVPFFMQQNLIDVTVTTTDNTVTSSTETHLATGDICYFVADTMPTGLKDGLYYYVRVDSTNSKKLTIFDTQKGAIENIKDDQVTLSAAGTNVKIVTNNVLSLGKKRTYTLDDINNAMEMTSKRGGHPTQAYMSSSKYREFIKLVLATMTATRKGNEKANATEFATSYQGAFGLVNANVHPIYPDNRIDILDLSYWDMKYLVKPHEVPPEKLSKDGTYEKFVIEASLGLKGTQPKASCSIVDIKR